MDHKANTVPTSETTALNVVLGASGGLGRAIVENLVRQGEPVRGVGRNTPSWAPTQCSWEKSDLEDRAEAIRACAGATTVYFAAQPPYGEWAARFANMTANVIESCALARAKLVMVDNLYMYGPAATGQLHEGLARAATGAKGRTRALMEEQLLTAHRSGQVKVTIGRASDYFGPNAANSTISTLVLEKATRGKAMQWPGRADQPRTVHYIDDAARALIVLGTSPLADGGVWHLPAAEPITGQEFMASVNRALIKPVKAKTIGTLMMRIGGMFSTEAKETVECMYQWTSPFVSDASAFLRTFGEFRVTPHAVAVASTVQSLTTH